MKNTVLPLVIVPVHHNEAKCRPHAEMEILLILWTQDQTWLWVALNPAAFKPKLWEF